MTAFKTMPGSWPTDFSFIIKTATHPPHAMIDRVPTSNFLISTHVRHRLATVTVRSDVLMWIRSGTKMLHNPSETLEVAANGALAVAQGTQWDITNDPRPMAATKP